MQFARFEDIVTYVWQRMEAYNVVYADPPWEYRSKKTGGGMNSGAAQKYQVMSLESLKKLPIHQITQTDTILLLWATVPLLPEAFELLKAWGFEYKTMVTWRKLTHNSMGYWFRGRTEHILVGTKGDVRAFHCQDSNIYSFKTSKIHSEKPAYFRDMFTKLTDTIFDYPRRIELFSRHSIEGWDSFGNEKIKGFNYS